MIHHQNNSGVGKINNYLNDNTFEHTAKNNQADVIISKITHIYIKTLNLLILKFTHKIV